jgi:hypothetical protein
VADEPVTGEPVSGSTLLAGNLQGILRISGRLARICPLERSKISWLEDNSLKTGTGNFIAQNKEFIETSREFAASCGELSAERGKFPGRAITVEEWASASHRGQMGFSSGCRRESRVQTRVKICADHNFVNGTFA